MVFSQIPESRSRSSLQGLIQAWLASWDFIENPFRLWEAGQEPSLNKYFIRRPYYDQLLSSPRSAIIMGPRGGGKTATRIMIQSECRPETASSSIFAIPFTDFSGFAEHLLSPQRYSLQDYLPYILAVSLRELFKAAAQLPQGFSPDRYPDLHEFRFWLGKNIPQFFTSKYLKIVIKKAAPRVSDRQIERWVQAADKNAGHEIPSGSIIDGSIRLWKALSTLKPEAPIVETHSPSHIMDAFVRFALRLLSTEQSSCDAVYLLVDGIDEFELTQNSPEASAELLRPLLGNLHFLEISNLAIKFFLPIEQQSAFEAITRLDRLETFFLKWEKSQPNEGRESLRELLRMRILSFHKRKYANLDFMCEPAVRHWLEDALLDEAGDSPRSLLRLANQVFVEHCLINPESETEIRLQDWERAVRHFRASLAAETMPEVASSAPELKAVESHGTTWLRVDLRSGRVFRGNEEIQPPLSELEFRLLAHLYRMRGKICSRSEVLRAVYETDPLIGERLDDQLALANEQSLTSLVYRLRKKIEPAGHTEPYFLHSIPGRGFRLENAI